jgi:hypothetical protein
MPDWVTTPIEFILGPLILLVILPVIPTIWIFLVYPIFAYRLKHSKISFSYWTRIWMFYLFTAIFCAPILPLVKDTVEHPQLLCPLLHSWGFRSLIIYSTLVLIFHKQINRLVDNSAVIQTGKRILIENWDQALVKIGIAKINNNEK